MVYADELSRMEDTSELFITRRTFTSIICRQVGGSVWGKPPLDCFAGGAVGQHKADKYYMPFHTIHSTGVDATVQVWAADAYVPGSHALLWVLPPFHFIGSVINILTEHVDAIFILLRFIRHWTAMISSLPVEDIHELSYHAGLYTVGSRAPESMQHNSPRYPLTAYLVAFAS
ncbi:TPA: hypothetical protein ACH3X2_013937 [Trebouxia sp. C0005]